MGAIQLPGPGAFGPPRDRDQALAVLRRAVELGVNHIDTAQFYGPNVSNELIRDALHPYPADLTLVSKVGARRDDAGGWLPLAEHFDELLSVMITARDEGLIGGIGLSNITRNHLLHALKRTEIVCVQNAFSLVNRASDPVLRECTERGIAFVPFFSVRSPFAPPDQVLGHAAVRQVAERLGHTPAQLVLAWTLSVAPNVVLIPGTSSVRHLEENVSVADIELDGQTREQLNAIAA